MENLNFFIQELNIGKIPEPEKAVKRAQVDVEGNMNKENKPLEKLKTGVKLDLDNKTTLAIAKEIEQNGGQIPYSRFMAESLFGEHGYYNSGKVEIGKDKDFVTSPELSEYFGAALSNAIKKIWEEMGEPENFRVIEMGAGQGAMANSILKWCSDHHPEFYQAVKYTILEYGQEMIPKQQKRIENTHNVSWVRGSASGLPFADVEGVFISNELPDAFPIERVKKLKGKLLQCYVSVENGEWVELWNEPSPEVKEYIDKFKIKIKEKQEEPINLNAVKFQEQLDNSLKRGAILTIDYGRNGEVGSPKSAATRFYGPNVAKEEKYELTPYRNPGSVDITASINFKILEKIAKKDGLQCVFSDTQRALLDGEVCGITEIVKKEKEKFLKNTPRKWEEIYNTARNITDAIGLVSGGMGEFYAQILTKEISMEEDPFKFSKYDADPDDYKLSIPIKISSLPPRQEVCVKKGSFSVWDDVVDNDGNIEIEINPTFLKDLKIYSKPNNRKLLDLSKDHKQYQKIIRNSGYEV